VTTFKSNRDFSLSRDYSISAQMCHVHNFKSKEFMRYSVVHLILTKRTKCTTVYLENASTRTRL